jgi:YVTN family beta-propeller protein
VLLGATLTLVALGCGDDAAGFSRVTLRPGPNPFGPDDPLWAPQPHRDRPTAVVLSAAGDKLYVALTGADDDPGHQIAVVDAATGRVLRRVDVGASPTGLALHPGGRWLAVCNRYSNWVSVIDTRSDRVAAEIEVPLYTVALIFAPDGRRAFLINRWKDSVLRWELADGEPLRVVDDDYSGLPLDLPLGTPVGANPRELALSADGRRLYVASPTAMTLSVLDTATVQELRRVELGSPPGGLAVRGERVYLSHTGRGSHHPPDRGEDTDGDGAPGDGTANVMFQDLQNELAVLDLDGNWVANYTSDTICCRDYRDVDPGEPTRGEALPAPDTWPRERVAFLPPASTWIVACALPEQLAIAGDRLYAVCSGSNEVQGFDIAADGTLSPRQRAGELFRTGMSPAGIAVTADGSRAWVAERLGEALSVLDLAAGPSGEQRWPVGDLAAGEFPATDAEIGEAINFVTAAFAVDGDQTCVHCHRDGGNVAKPVAMPLQADPVWGTRMQMAYRGAADTRPWFFETAMDETNFFPVINELARKENFCCEQLDPLIWGAYPSLSECSDDPARAGCGHVLHCDDDPPPECGARRYGSPYRARDQHFLAAARALIGRERSFGDALYEEIVSPDGAIDRRGIRLDFDGVTRALGLFLLAQPRLLPNPNAIQSTAAARRGRLIYESPTTGCALCHPLPTTTLSTAFNPRDLPLRFSAVITPRLDPETGANADRVNPRFAGAFPDTAQDDSGVRFGVPQLRGIWDRAPRFLHDGRARSLREVLATPGHPALRPSETGYNETYGMPDTHGATSHLTAEELEDLVAFVETL